jgi:hypothetical protein
VTDLARIAEHERYLHRRSDYRFRCRRYAITAQLLAAGSLADDQTLVDVAAGWTELDFHLRTELGWRGRYIPVDGAIDGVDLDQWVPPCPRDWFVALEILEHLDNPERLARALLGHAQAGVIVTTPNPAVVDVLAMDPTHRTAITADELRRWGLHTEATSLYGTPGDGLVAWQHRQPPPRAHGGPPPCPRTSISDGCSSPVS